MERRGRESSLWSDEGEGCRENTEEGEFIFGDFFSVVPLQSLKMLMLSDEHRNYGNEFHFVGPVKKERKKVARCPNGFVFVKGMRKVFVSEMELEKVVKG